MNASAVISFRRGNQPELHFGFSSGNNEVGYVTAGQTDDDGTAITSRWRSGWFDYNNPNVKTIRETKLWGTGGMTAKFSKDFAQAASATDIVAFDSGNDTVGGWY